MFLIRRQFVKFVLAACALSVPCAVAAQDGPAPTAEKLTVVELFTSQGCSSCPPADANLFALSDQPDLLTLSWAVDYWDRLGWRDTFADEDYTRRQHAYNKRFGRSGVYTPQMVIDGELQAIGSRKSEVRDAIDKARESKLLYIAPAIHPDGDGFKVVLPSTNLTGKIMVHVVWYMGNAVVEVGSGENGGRRLHYTNIVRENAMLGTWDGVETKIKLPGMEAAQAKGADHVAVLLQAGNGEGAIVGAARARIKTSN